MANKVSHSINDSSKIILLEQDQDETPDVEEQNSPSSVPADTGSYITVLTGTKDRQAGEGLVLVAATDIDHTDEESWQLIGSTEHDSDCEGRERLRGQYYEVADLSTKKPKKRPHRLCKGGGVV